MQKLIIAAVVGLLSVQSYADDFTDTAKVISSTPIYQTIHGQACYEVPVASQPSGGRSMGGSILGGLAGALLGSQVGQGNGRIAAGAAGAIAGAIAGDRIQNEGNGSNAGGTRHQCNDITKQVVSGYDVKYLYAGHIATTTMATQPGNTISVGVTALD
jgi:uncharacterized protein YcfJ